MLTGNPAVAASAEQPTSLSGLMVAFLVIFRVPETGKAAEKA